MHYYLTIYDAKHWLLGQKYHFTNFFGLHMWFPQINPHPPKLNLLMKDLELFWASGSVTSNSPSLQNWT